MRKIRPLQAKVYASYRPGSVCPLCEWHFRGWSEIASHWQAGHFDIETNEPMSPSEAANEVIALHNTARTLRATMANKLAGVTDAFDKMTEALQEMERRLNALAVEVGKLKAQGS